MKKLILHIGHEKTGSTFLQTTLNLNQQRLADAGWVYPLVGGRSNHLKLALSFPDDDGDHGKMALHMGLATRQDREGFRQQFAEQLAREVKDGQTWLLSTEYFATRLTTDEAISGLMDFLRPHFDEITGMGYFRRPDFALPSLYSQSMKAAGNALFTWKYCAHRIPKLMVDDIHERWVRHLGEGNFLGRPYLEQWKSSPNDLVADFAKSLGLPQDIDLELVSTEKRNHGLSAEGGAFLRAVNPYTQRLTADGRSVLAHRNRVVNAVSELTPGPSVRLTAELQQHVKDTFDASNAALAARYPDDADWQTWISQPMAEPATDAQMEISAARTAELMVKLAVPNGIVDWGQPNGVPLKPAETTKQKLRRRARKAKALVKSKAPKSKAPKSKAGTPGTPGSASTSSKSKG